MPLSDVLKNFRMMAKVFSDYMNFGEKELADIRAKRKAAEEVYARYKKVQFR